jgi:hypothetical protein
VNTFHDVAATNPSLYVTTSAALATLDSKASDFVAKYDIWHLPSTRTKPALEAKNASKDDLLAYFRPLVQDVTNAVTMDNTKRAALGIPLRATSFTPITAPTEAPVPEIAEMNGWKAKIKVRPAGSEGRSSRPANVSMLFVYSAVGTAPPTNLNEYKFEGPSSRAIFEVQFDSGLTVGTKVWVCACWVTARGLTSPAFSPIGLLIGGGKPEVDAA